MCWPPPLHSRHRIPPHLLAKHGRGCLAEKSIVYRTAGHCSTSKYARICFSCHLFHILNLIIVSLSRSCLSQLSDRFARNRLELATELDSRVAKLCQILEDIFCHGMKRNITLRLLNSPPQVDCCLQQLWQFISTSTVLNRHEYDRFMNLKNINTDSGRARSWIRSTINESSLSRYLEIIYNSSETSKYYEKWAFLMTTSTQNTLLEIASVLATLLFAINIDKAELNTSPPGTRNTSRTEMVDPQPVFPQREVPKSLNLRKPSTRVIYLGDEDDEGESDNTTPPINSSTSSRRDRHLMLTPLEADFSDSEFGASTEESAESHPSSYTEEKEVFDFTRWLAEKENLQRDLLQKEQLNESLMKENQVLKLQVKKYLSAIALIAKDKNVDTECAPYQDAEEYEKKLVQVAEMHGELVEFNERLQKVILQKDAMIRRLREELIEVRGPLPNAVEVGELDEISFVSDVSSVQTIPSSLTRPLVNIYIPTAFLSGQPKTASHHLYQIFIRIKDEEWNVYRRYSQFLELHRKMIKLYPTVADLDFPPKKTFSNRDARVVQERRKRLETYLRSLVNLLTCENEISDRRSLITLIPFLGVR